MHTLSYRQRREELETYFDRTAAKAWEVLTSDTPLGKIRATVRAGRDRMRGTLLSWLPENLSGKTLLDAGCGTGALSVEAARRGADVTAIDLSETLVTLAEQRLPDDLGTGSVTFAVGDMLDPALGRFDHIVGMDSLIHYQADDLVSIVERLAGRAEESLLFTFAPRTPALSVKHAVGKFFPKSDRAPAIEPLSETHLRRAIQASTALTPWSLAQTARIHEGFYTSQAVLMTKQMSQMDRG